MPEITPKHRHPGTLTVSIVIPGYNCAGTIKRCLESVLTQDYPHIIQIIFVDDGSQDATPSVVSSFDRVQYIRQANAGPAHARNRGAAAATGSLIAFIDADCIAHSDWITNLVSCFTANTIGAATGRYGLANPQSLLARCIHQEIIYRHKRYSAREIRFFGSYNVCLPKDVFENVGGYDSQYRRASAEDNDLSYRLSKWGYKICYESRAVVDHYHPERLIKYLSEQYVHGYWRAQLYRTHPGMMRGDDYTFWKDILETLLALFVLALGLMVMMAPPVILTIAGIAVLFLSLLEIFFGWRIMHQTRAGLCFAWVMFWRSFARAIGFMHGGLSFITLTLPDSRETGST